MNNIHDFVQNETAWICATFGADLMKISEVTSHKTKLFRSFGLSCIV